MKIGSSLKPNHQQQIQKVSLDQICEMRSIGTLCKKSPFLIFITKQPQFKDVVQLVSFNFLVDLTNFLTNLLNKILENEKLWSVTYLLHLPLF